MTTKFRYGDRVRIKLPGKRAFRARVYSVYQETPRGERRICVDHMTGCHPDVGQAFLVRYVSHVE